MGKEKESQIYCVPMCQILVASGGTNTVTLVCLTSYSFCHAPVPCLLQVLKSNVSLLLAKWLRITFFLNATGLLNLGVYRTVLVMVRVEVTKM